MSEMKGISFSFSQLVLLSFEEKFQFSILPLGLSRDRKNESSQQKRFESNLETIEAESDFSSSQRQIVENVKAANVETLQLAALDQSFERSYVLVIESSTAEQ